MLAGDPSVRRLASNCELSDPPIGAGPTYSTLTRAVPMAFMSRTSATREDTSITRPP